MKAPRYVLCLDAGFANTGIAVWACNIEQWVHLSCLTTEGTPKKDRARSGVKVVDDDTRRIEELIHGIGTIMERYRPVVVFAELPTGAAKSAKAAKCMAMATAIVITLCKARKVLLRPTSPLETKRLVSLKGAVSKEQVQAYVEKKYGKLLPKAAIREHIADAIMTFEVGKTRFKTDIYG